MRTVGFIISNKADEKRRLILPEHIEKIHYPEYCFFEKGYGNSILIDDKEYSDCGCKMVDREMILKCDIIADRKLGDADYLSLVQPGKILVGAAHAVQGIEFTNEAIRGRHTVIATEELFEDNRYIFYKNNELAGAAAVMHAFRFSGKMPNEAKAAIIGSGNVAKGALRILHGLGAEVDVYGRKHEALFRKELYHYDVIINCVKWDTNRKDHLIYKSDLKKMKKGTLIIDISCDPHLGIETSHATTISDPVYEIDGVIHYAVDNTPSMFPYSATKIFSEKIYDFINSVMENDINEFPSILRAATVIYKGEIRDDRIRMFRNQRGLFC